MRKIRVNPNCCVKTPPNKEGAGNGKLLLPGTVIPANDIPKAVLEDWVKSGHVTVLDADAHAVEGKPFDIDAKIPGQELSTLQLPKVNDNSNEPNQVTVVSSPEAPSAPGVDLSKTDLADGEKDFTRDELEGADLADLNALVAERWNKPEAEAPVFEDVEEAKAYLCGEKD